MFWQRRPSIANPIRTSLVVALLVAAGVISSAVALRIHDVENAEQHRENARRLRSAGEYSVALVHAQQAVVLDEQAAPPDDDALARSLVLTGSNQRCPREVRPRRGALSARAPHRRIELESQRASESGGLRRPCRASRLVGEVSGGGAAGQGCIDDS